MVNTKVVTDFDFRNVRGSHVKDVSVITESGASYTFMVKDGNLFFSRGLNICGKVLKFDSPAKVGTPLSFSFHGSGLYSSPNELVSHRNSSPVVKIIIEP